jgi:4-carboxymuconolactone decarboxylase
VNLKKYHLAAIILIAVLITLSATYLIASNNSRRSNRMEEASGNARFKRGLAKINQIDGHAGEKVINALKDLSPDLARYTIEFPFGDVYSRHGLDLKSREIATVASLATLGTIPQLKVHIHAALNVGCTETEIKEVIIQMAVYAGFPKALNAMFAAGEVFKERRR